LFAFTDVEDELLRKVRIPLGKSKNFVYFFSPIARFFAINISIDMNVILS